MMIYKHGVGVCAYLTARLQVETSCLLARQKQKNLWFCILPVVCQQKQEAHSSV